MLSHPSVIILCVCFSAVSGVNEIDLTALITGLGFVHVDKLIEDMEKAEDIWRRGDTRLGSDK